MKKLMTILAVFAMCGVAMAYEPYNLTMDKDKRGNKIDTTYSYKNGEGTTGLTYTVINSNSAGYKADKNGVNYNRQFAQVYFTTTTDIPDNKVLAVQFLGAEVEVGNNAGFGSGYDPNYKVKDYGIYLYDPATGKRTSDYLSVQNYSNYFGEKAGVKAGTSFGVYFVDKNGNYIASTGDGMKKDYSIFSGYYGDPKKAENGIVGNFDDDSHELKVYNKDTGLPETKTTDKHFLCLSAGDYGWDGSSFRQTHWEFMLQTTLDNPYFPVNPNDFNDDVHVDDPVVDGVTGQPLPGTLATLLIGGLCASSLRKRNKKH